jgi:hypothetical protein
MRAAATVRQQPAEIFSKKTFRFGLAGYQAAARPTSPRSIEYGDVGRAFAVGDAAG